MLSQVIAGIRAVWSKRSGQPQRCPVRGRDVDLRPKVYPARAALLHGRRTSKHEPRSGVLVTVNAPPAADDARRRPAPGPAQRPSGEERVEDPGEDFAPCQRRYHGRSGAGCESGKIRNGVLAFYARDADGDDPFVVAERLEAFVIRFMTTCRSRLAALRAGRFGRPTLRVACFAIEILSNPCISSTSTERSTDVKLAAPCPA